LPASSAVRFLSSRRERFNPSPGRPRGALGTGAAIPRAPKGAIRSAHGQGTPPLAAHTPLRLNRPTSGALVIGGVSQGSRWSPWARAESPPFGGWRIRRPRFAGTGQLLGEEARFRRNQRRTARQGCCSSEMHVGALHHGKTATQASPSARQCLAATPFGSPRAGAQAAPQPKPARSCDASRRRREAGLRG